MPTEDGTLIVNSKSTVNFLEPVKGDSNSYTILLQYCAKAAKQRYRNFVQSILFLLQMTSRIPFHSLLEIPGDQTSFLWNEIQRIKGRHNPQFTQSMLIAARIGGHIAIGKQRTHRATYFKLFWWFWIWTHSLMNVSVVSLRVHLFIVESNLQTHFQSDSESPNVHAR